LGKIGNADAIPHLLPLLRDVNLAVRLSAVQALTHIADQGTIPYLREVSEHDSDETVRGEAKRALSHIIHAW
jgi:HEAT repeat protein